MADIKAGIKGAITGSTSNIANAINLTIGAYLGNKFVTNYAIPKLKPLIKAAKGDDIDIVKDFEKNRVMTLHEMDELIKKLDEFGNKVKGIKNVDTTESVEETHDDEFDNMELPSFDEE